MNQLVERSAQRGESGAKKFWRIVFGTMVGFIFSCFVVWILSMVMMGIMIGSLMEEKPVISENSILKITLQNPIQERALDNPFEEFEGLSSYYETSTGLDDILKCIDAASTDPKIKGIYLNVSSIQAAPATVKEIRDALAKFKKSGKFIYSYSEIYSQKGYWLSSISDQIYLNQKGLFEFKGLSFQVLFFKGLIDKLDLDIQVVRHGQFKSAVEPYILDKMSDANRTQYTKLANTLWNTVLEDIFASRQISLDTLNYIADNLLCENPQKVLSLNLVDKLCYKNEFDADLKAKMQLSSEEKLNFVTLNEYKKTINTRYVSSSNEIAVVYAIGNIIDGKGDEQTIGSETLSKEIRSAYQNKDVKAIVLRVNSPGGSALASEVIWNEIELAKKAGKIVVASMGDYAASGGYYISCNADAIVAQPNTLTGSIGVFGMIPSVQNMLKNKLGITVDRVTTNQHADYGSGYRQLDELELQKMQIMVEDVYATFTQRVADGRKKDIQYIDEIGQGRVWSGADALELGLVDQLGTINDAIILAAKIAKISDYNITYYPKKKDWFTKLFEKDNQEVAISQAIQNELGDLYSSYKSMKIIMDAKGIQARMPFEIVME